MVEFKFRVADVVNYSQRAKVEPIAGFLDKSNCFIKGTKLYGFTLWSMQKLAYKSEKEKTRYKQSVSSDNTFLCLLFLLPVLRPDPFARRRDSVLLPLPERSQE